MPEYLTPGVYFELQDKTPPVIRQVRTDITGFVGLAERGPLNKPVQIESWRQFQSQFGDFVAYGFLSYAVKGFFENGGRTCFVVRVAGVTAQAASLVLRNKDSDPDKNAILKLEAKNRGSWGNQMAIALTQVSPSNLSFSLVVIRDRRDREVFPSLSLDLKSDRYFARVINQGTDRLTPSQWITVQDLIDPTATRNADCLPNGKQSGLKNQIGFLIGGEDGIDSLTLADFLGSLDPLASQKIGLSALDAIDAVGIVCIPDLHIAPVPLPPPAPSKSIPPQDPCLPTCSVPPASIPTPPKPTEQPPQFSRNQIIAAQQTMIEHCERHQDRIAILDAPLNVNSDRSLTLAEVQDWRQQFDSERGFAALYYPWIRVVDPLKLGGNPVRTIPSGGHVAGLYARSDFEVGPHKAPANGELFWAEDVTVAINDDQQAIFNPEGINCIRAFAGRGIRVYGARTVSSNPDWRYINVRRLMMMIEEAVDESTQWAVFEPNDFNLRRSLILSVSGFLETLWRRGALVGETAEEAFYIKCDETNNPPEIVNQGKILTEIGVAPTHPAEFIVFRVGRTLEELEIVER
ncbi:phage tail sheath family protein [Nostoc sp.]|uniref:phage tail sheath family protein n=1 Tax=Nostoc sp. TaxID=1180 RepID=UPI002FF8CFDF